MTCALKWAEAILHYVMEEHPEDWLTLKQAARRLPGRPSYQAVRKWCIDGVKNFQTGQKVKLGSKMIGGRRFISLQSLENFIEELN